jgi:hypothetical protein
VLSKVIALVNQVRKFSEDHSLFTEYFFSRFDKALKQKLSYWSALPKVTSKSSSLSGGSELDGLLCMTCWIVFSSFAE